MNNLEQLIGESIWGTYRSMASILMGEAMSDEERVKFRKEQHGRITASRARGGLTPRGEGSMRKMTTTGALDPDRARRRVRKIWMKRVSKPGPLSKPPNA